MAAVLPANSPSNLLQRRLSQGQYGSMDIAGLMSTFNIQFRPEAAAASTSMPALYGQQHHPQHMQGFESSLLPGGMINPSAVHASSGASVPFTNPYNLSSGFAGASFGSFGWQTALPMHDLTGTHAPLLRSESNGSSDSEPYIKTEGHSPVRPSQVFYDAGFYSMTDGGSAVESSDEGGKPVVFSTEIDTLMRAIQSQSDTPEKKHSVKSKSSEASSVNRPRKKYMCEVMGCGKSFYQKTHLEIHTRAHTGIKPFLCKEPSCGQRFSQLGNLKTHERRHTGERPYHCDICFKTFAQHGNVRAHKVVHTSAKPFICKLDNCNKQFTQLGNLKSHQNKFHIETIRRLKLRFENFKEGDVVDSWEKEMWEYFGGLYKNCNKGIKGRGKDRRINNTLMLSRGSRTGFRRDSIGSASSSESIQNGSGSGSSEQQRRY